MKKFIYLIPLALFLACGSEETSTGEAQGKDESGNEISVVDTNKVNPYTPGEGLDAEALFDEIDLSMDISGLSLQDVRLLRNAFAARQGYCFMKADLRGFYSATSWYDEVMEARFWAEDDGSEMAPISYTKDEQDFIDRLKQREDELKSQNYGVQNNRKMANLNNVVNMFQLEDADPKLMDMLGNNGFAIVPNNNIQLFHVYEKNDYTQFPNFVTTDMYMQLFHMYFGYVLRSVEEEKFIPLLAELCKGMYDECEFIAVNGTGEIAESAEFNMTYYAIPYYVLTEKKLSTLR